MAAGAPSLILETPGWVQLMGTPLLPLCTPSLGPWSFLDVQMAMTDMWDTLSSSMSLAGPQSIQEEGLSWSPEPITCPVPPAACPASHQISNVAVKGKIPKENRGPGSLSGAALRSWLWQRWSNPGRGTGWHLPVGAEPLPPPQLAGEITDPSQGEITLLGSCHSLRLLG